MSYKHKIQEKLRSVGKSDKHGRVLEIVIS